MRPAFKEWPTAKRETMRRKIAQVQLVAGALLSEARRQARDWQHSIRRGMRKRLAFCCWLVALTPAYMVSQLPDGLLETLLDNIAHPLALFSIVYLLTMAWIGFEYGRVGAKLTASL